MRGPHLASPSSQSTRSSSKPFDKVQKGNYEVTIRHDRCTNLLLFWSSIGLVFLVSFVMLWNSVRRRTMHNTWRSYKVFTMLTTLAREGFEGTCDTQSLRFYCELGKQKTQTTSPRKKCFKFLALCLPLGRDALMRLARQVMQREVEELSSQKTKKMWTDWTGIWKPCHLLVSMQLFLPLAIATKFLRRQLLVFCAEASFHFSLGLLWRTNLRPKPERTSRKGKRARGSIAKDGTSWNLANVALMWLAM